MRLEDYLSCLLNETKWYSFSRTNFDELTELTVGFSQNPKVRLARWGIVAS